MGSECEHFIGVVKEWGNSFGSSSLAMEPAGKTQIIMRQKFIIAGKWQQACLYLATDYLLVVVDLLEVWQQEERRTASSN